MVCIEVDSGKFFYGSRSAAVLAMLLFFLSIIMFSSIPAGRLWLQRKYLLVIQYDKVLYIQFCGVTLPFRF